jgi:hypothetical protein
VNQDGEQPRVVERALLELAKATHAGTTTGEFQQIVIDWIGRAKHPETGRSLTKMVCLPMLELLDYLRANDFKTFIVSGGGIEFMGPWVDDVCGIPPEPIGINQHIGRRPIMAFGNSDGEFQMLEWMTSGPGPRLGAIVHRTDDKRDSHVGRLEIRLSLTAKREATIDSRSNDRTIDKRQEHRYHTSPNRGLEPGRTTAGQCRLRSNQPADDQARIDSHPVKPVR